MKLTKLGHSCVLLEVEDRVVLYDPGVWSTELDVDALEGVNRIVYTHPHPDHFDIDTLNTLLEKFPDAHVIAHEAIRAAISHAGIEAQLREESDCCSVFESPHEQVPVLHAPETPENGYHFRELFTHPGDSHSFRETKKVLAMPFLSPWGSTTDAVRLALELKPEVILPIHDWHYTPEAREWLDGLLQKAFEGSGIELLPSTPGITHEIAE